MVGVLFLIGELMWGRAPGSYMLIGAGTTNAVGLYVLLMRMDDKAASIGLLTTAVAVVLGLFAGVVFFGVASS